METWKKKENEPLNIWGKSIPGKGALQIVQGSARRPVRQERSEQVGVK